MKTTNRLLSLDVMRGITIAGMILVNDPGSWNYVYAPLQHAQWNGLTPTDLVFPFFMFIMGISMYLSLSKYNFQLNASSLQKIITRTIVIFVVGIGLNLFSHVLNNGFHNFENLRILGVMQRLAIAYGIGSIIGLLLNGRSLLPVSFLLLTGYTLLLTLTDSLTLSTHNIIGVVDKALFGETHLYRDWLPDGTMVPLFTNCYFTQEKGIERIKVTPVVVYEDIESRFPGELMFCDNYLIWTDPYSVEGDGYVHIVDLKTKEEIGQFFDMGQGPKEFINPNLIGGVSNKIVKVFESKTNKMASLYLDSLKIDSSPIRYKSDKRLQRATRVAQTKEEELIILQPAQEPILHFNDQEFGDIPFNENVTNWFDVMQGNILYNSERNLLVYSNLAFPYIVLYKKENNRFEKVWERKDKFDYEIVNNKMRVGVKRRGAAELALTKDYIVTSRRDYDKDPTDESTVGRDFSKVSKNLFIYDYDSNLIKILDLGASVIRLAGDENTNTVYAIVVDPDFQIVKLDIDNPELSE